MKTFTNKKKRLTRSMFMLNALLFIVSGLSLLGEQKFAFGIIQIIGGIINFAMLFLTEKHQKNGSLLILVINVIVSLLVAYDFVKSGKTYLQYAWIMAAIFYLTAFIISYKKAQINQKRSEGFIPRDSEL